MTRKKILNSTYIAIVFLLMACGSGNNDFISHSRSGCSKPEFNKKESVYFKQLERKYHCTVDRTLNTHILKNDKDRDYAHYSLIFRDFPDSIHSLGIDNLRIIAYEIGDELHTEILDSEYEYAYDEIEVGFDPVNGGQDVFSLKHSNNPRDKIKLILEKKDDHNSVSPPAPTQVNPSINDHKNETINKPEGPTCGGSNEDTTRYQNDREL